MAKYDLNELFGAADQDPEAEGEGQTEGGAEEGAAEGASGEAQDGTGEGTSPLDDPPAEVKVEPPAQKAAAAPAKPPAAPKAAASAPASTPAAAKAPAAPKPPAAPKAPPKPAAPPPPPPQEEVQAETGASEEGAGEAAQPEVEQEIILPKGKPSTAAATTTQTKAPATAKKPAAAPALPTGEEETAIVPGGAQVPAGAILTATFGTKVARFPIEKFKASTAAKSRIALPILEANGKGMLVISKTHYSEETGNFYCFGGSCCEHMCLPAVHYNFPIVVYNTDKKGNVVSAEFDIKYLSCAQTRYEEFLTYHEGGTDLTTVDFVVTCEDDTYQKLKLACFPNAIWRRNKDFAREVLQKLLKVWAFVGQCIAMKMTPERLAEKLGIAPPGEDAPQETKFDLDAFLKG